MSSRSSRTRPASNNHQQQVSQSRRQTRGRTTTNNNEGRNNRTTGVAAAHQDDRSLNRMFARVDAALQRLVGPPNEAAVTRRLHVVLELMHQPRRRRTRRRAANHQGQARPVTGGDALEMMSVSSEETLRARRLPAGRTRCSHSVYDWSFCSKCHTNRRHLSRWWWQNRYKQH
ncbi:uncharacterized protein LOC106637372 [Copidosoma floridanum]|uniref:uncharacterized protein LOC106637372 n=1 Tax=Copidosoma floridanum TaxID=29053 RepID=UPI0006C9BC27|nr:uncharacterized protein LOC106637372 [Copidosoma floridanum]